MLPTKLGTCGLRRRGYPRPNLIRTNHTPTSAKTVFGQNRCSFYDGTTDSVLLLVDVYY